MTRREKLLDLIQSCSDDKVTKVYDLFADKFAEDEKSRAVLDTNEQVSFDNSGYIIIRYIAQHDMLLNKEMKLCVSYHNVEFAVTATESTIFASKGFIAGEELIIIASISGDKCHAEAVMSMDFFDMFRSFDSCFEKVLAIKRYYALPETLRKNIAQQASGKRFPLASSVEAKVTGGDNLSLKFKICKDTYTPQQQVDIEGMFEDSKKLGTSNREKVLRRLAYILNIDQTIAPEIRMTKEEIIAELDKYLYKMDNAKNKFAEAMIAAKYADQKGMAILLVGSPGVGKTGFIKAASRVLNRPCFVLSLGSATSMVDIVGDAQHYDCSDCGEVVKNFYKYGTTTVVVGLDEYGQAADIAKEGGKVSKAFNDALSDEHFFKDVFLGTSINTSNTIFIATTNSTETIPENLLNRFQVIQIDDYTEEEKVEIGCSYILPEILSTYNVDTDEIIISRENVAYIVENFCEDDGARDLKKHLKVLVNAVLSKWDSSGERHSIEIDREFIETTLENSVDKNSPIIVFHRNKAMYSAKVEEEIKSLIEKCRRDDLDAALREKYEKKLKYLVYSIPVGDAFSEFDEEKFYNQVNKTHYGLEDVKKSIAQTFYISSIMKKPLTSNRILLVGPPGIGKTSIVKSIAIACNAKYAKVSLNGVSDDTVIKGHNLTYSSSDSGSIIKAAYGMKTTKGIIHLDEIDKMGTREGVDVSNTLIDLLDDSAEFTDSFLSIPIDFTNTLFIATANNASAINQPLMDRFTVIYLEGYTERQKAAIIENYVIPRVLNEMCPENLLLSFSDAARILLVTKYCKSFGVRDADRIIRKLVKEKVYAIREDGACKCAMIDIGDIEQVLGMPSAERGNFPYRNYPGLSRALAVTGDNCGMSFAIETMLLPDDNSLIITGLPKESTIDSVKLAVSYVKRNYPGTVTGKGIHIHFGEGAVVKDGPSAGVAILMSLISAALDKSIEENAAYTGEINGNGYVFNIGGTIAKIQAAEQSGCSKVFIPYGNYIELNDEEKSQFTIEIVPIKHISEIVEAVLPDEAKVG